MITAKDTYGSGCTNGIGSASGIGSAAAVLGAPRANVGLIERQAGLVSGLQSLYAKMCAFSDRIEGTGTVECKNSDQISAGLGSQIAECENALRACHALLDDIAGKF